MTRNKDKRAGHVAKAHPLSHGFQRAGLGQVWGLENPHKVSSILPRPHQFGTGG